MSDIASVTAQQPAPQPYEPIRALLRAGRNDEAIVKLCAIVVTRPDDLAAKELLFDAFFRSATGRRPLFSPRSWPAVSRKMPACREP